MLTAGLNKNCELLSSGRDSVLIGLCTYTHTHIMHTHTRHFVHIFSPIYKRLKSIRAKMPKNFRAQNMPPWAPGPRYETMRLNIYPLEFCLYHGPIFYSPALFFFEWEYSLCAILCWMNVIFISQGDSAQNLF